MLRLSESRMGSIRGVRVGDGARVGASVRLAVRVTVGEREGVGVSVALAEAVGVGVAVPVAVGVGVWLGAGVRVAVEVEVAVGGKIACQGMRWLAHAPPSTISSSSKPVIALRMDLGGACAALRRVAGDAGRPAGWAGTGASGVGKCAASPGGSGLNG